MLQKTYIVVNPSGQCSLQVSVLLPKSVVFLSVPQQRASPGVPVEVLRVNIPTPGEERIKLPHQERLTVYCTNILIVSTISLIFLSRWEGIKGKNTVLLIWGEMITLRVSLSLITITKWCRIQREPSWQENLAPDQTESCQGISTDKYLDHNCPISNNSCCEPKACCSKIPFRNKMQMDNIALKTNHY